MTTNGPDVVSNSRGGLGASPAGPGAVGKATSGGLGLAHILAVVAGIVAGSAAFGIGEGTAELIPPEKVQFNVFGQTRGMASRDTPRVVTRTAALAFGVLGLCLGGCLGIAGGVARRRAAAAVTGGLLGAVLGAVRGRGRHAGALAVVPRIAAQPSES